MLYTGPVQIFQDDKVNCGFPNDDPATVPTVVAAAEIGSFCEQNQNKSVKGGSALEYSSNFDSGVVLNITVSLDPACAGDGHEILNLDDCHYFLNQTITECDTQSAAKSGGVVQNACIDYTLHPQDNMGELQCVGQG